MYDERADRSNIGTTGMSTAGLSGGTSSGYAGQPSGHVSGSDLSTEHKEDNTADTGSSDRGYGEFASVDATKVEQTRSGAPDPRDKDGDGWVADDKMREWGRDIKDAVQGAGHKMKEEGREVRDEGRYRMDEAERRRRARVYDRTFI